MSKIISTKKINAGFLAIVLIVGTFAAISPSFMVGAHAQQYGMDQQKYNSYESDYGMDNSYDNKQSYGKDSNSYDKSKDSSSTIVKKIKCNNINVNVNGFNGIELGDALPTSTLNALATDEAQAADEGKIGTSSFGSDGRSSGHDSNSRFVCIDNNNFNVNEGGTTPPEPLNCEECFKENLSPMQVIAFEAFLDTTLPIIIGGEQREINNIADLCEVLGIAITEESLEFIATFLNQIIIQGGITDIDVREDIILCVGDALGIDIPIIS